IPNTEVKLLSADGSWDFVPVRVGRCQANEAQPDKGCVFLYILKEEVVESCPPLISQTPKKSTKCF
ncbi:hypothetical protein ACIQAA_30245, partial [Neobacillus sp. NPDC093182]|uniref:hypothetical protein n=1 Tax=Neobacillus sp. NPDC093182 TaxID=3364297 RepID=UPI0038092232